MHLFPVGWWYLPCCEPASSHIVLPSTFRNSAVPAYRWRRKRITTGFLIMSSHRQHVSLPPTSCGRELVIWLCLGAREFGKYYLWLGSSCPMMSSYYEGEHRILLKGYFCHVKKDERSLAYHTHPASVCVGQNTKTGRVASLRSGNWQLNAHWILVSSC